MIEISRATAADCAWRHALARDAASEPTIDTAEPGSAGVCCHAKCAPRCQRCPVTGREAHRIYGSGLLLDDNGEHQAVLWGSGVTEEIVEWLTG
jgi:hypothetical protein